MYHMYHGAGARRGDPRKQELIAATVGPRMENHRWQIRRGLLIAAKERIHHRDTEVTERMGKFRDKRGLALIRGALWGSGKIRAKQSQFAGGAGDAKCGSGIELWEKQAARAVAKTKPITPGV
jgi:hypothetical protein